MGGSSVCVPENIQTDKNRPKADILTGVGPGGGVSLPSGIIEYGRQGDAQWKSPGCGYPFSTAFFARFTRSLALKPVISSKKVRNRLLVSRISASDASLRETVFTTTVFPPAPGHTSRRDRAPKP